MSSYENYTTISGTYDVTRDAVGAEIILGCLGRMSVPLAQQKLLDAGCGTGNYTRALTDSVHSIAAVDLNEGMLQQARSKLDAQRLSKVQFHQSSISSLPFEADSFDAVMVNQVLHHLPEAPGSGYAQTRAAVTELARVLKPGGNLTVNICSHNQLRRGFWYAALIPEISEKMCDRHIPLETLMSMLDGCGFDCLGRLVPLDLVLQGQAYFNHEGPLDPSWRNGDSIWSTVGEERLEEVISQVRRMARDGSLKAFMHNNDADRQDIGQLTFIHARKRR